MYAKHAKAQLSLFLGIGAAFVSLLCLGTIIGIPGDSVIAAGLFFTLILAAIFPLLFRRKNAPDV